MEFNDSLAVIYSGSLQDAQEISALLMSGGIYAEYHSTTRGWVVLTGEMDRSLASELISSHQISECDKLAELTQEKRSKTGSLINQFGLGVFGFLIIFFMVTGPLNRTSIFFQNGALIKNKVFDGEIWRVVTALTMHGDAAHLAGNIFALLVFGGAVCQILGVGRGWFVILMTGIIGNLAKIVIHSYQYFSIGSSTSVFGAVGLLGGLGFIRERKRNTREAWLSIAGAFTLLIVLGSNKNADMLAHFYGFLAGLLFSPFLKNTTILSRASELLLKRAFVAIIIISWSLALFVF